MAVPMVSDLQFDADTHTYRLGGRVLPSVTQILGAVLPGWQASEWYLQKGRALHHGCRLLSERRLDWASVDPAIEGRLRAWQRFLAECGSEVVNPEFRMANKLYGFAGTMDCALDAHIPCDLKSTIQPQVRVQLGGYSVLYSHQVGTKPSAAVAVELRDDGSYRCLWLNAHELRRAEQTFLACLTVYGFMSQHNMKGQANGH